MRSYANLPIGTVPRLRELRRNAPEPERRLLSALRGSFPHLKWRHQGPLGPYKADILCFSEKLVIEVDGDTHAQTAEYDAARTRFIEREGYRVMRFTNTDVMQNLEGVIATIPLFFQEREGARSAQPSGKGEDSIKGKAQ